MKQPPLQDYAVIGDCRSAALISRAGSIDWLCWPRFDSSSLFAAILDPGGGHWTIAPAAEARVERRYLPDTNVRETRFCTGVGALVLSALMPVGTATAPPCAL